MSKKISLEVSIHRIELLHQVVRTKFDDGKFNKEHYEGYVMALDDVSAMLDLPVLVESCVIYPGHYRYAVSQGWLASLGLKKKKRKKVKNDE